MMAHDNISCDKKLRRSSSSSSSASASSSSSMLSKLLLPDGVREVFLRFLDANSLYSLTCAHAKLNAYYAAVDCLTLENVNEARLQSLLNALSKSDIQIKSLHFHADVDWNNQEKLVLEFSYALHQGKFRRLESLDLSQTVLDKFELDSILGNLRHTSIKSLQFPILDAPLEHIRSLPVMLTSLQDLEEIGQRHGGADRTFHHVMDCAAQSSEFASRIKTLDFIRSWGEIRDNVGFGIGASLLNQHSETLFAGKFCNLQVLRLEGGAADGPQAINAFVGHVLGTAWSRGLFKHLREFALFLAKAQDTGVIKPLAEAWRTTATENTLHLEVLRLQGLFLRFQGGVDLASAFLIPNRFPSLKILNLCDNLLGDIGLIKLSEAIAAGFAPSLQELEFSLSNKVRRSQQTTISAEGLRDLGAAFRLRRDRYPCLLRRLRMGGQYIGDEGVRELADAWAQGSFLELDDLDLRENVISDEGMSYLLDSGMIGETFSKLGRLVLERNSISGEGFRRGGGGGGGDATAMTLTRLNISRNDFTVEGMETMLETVGPGLKELRIGSEGNVVAGAGGGEEVDESMQYLLAKGLGHLTDLRRLDIRRCQMTKEMVEVLIEKIREEGQLKKLCQLEMQVRGTDDYVEEVKRRIRELFTQLDVLVVCKWAARW